MDNKSSEPLPEIENKGWDWFEEKVEKQTQTIVDKRMGMSPDDINAHFRKCFSTKSGQIVLQYFEVIQNDVMCFDPSLGFYNGSAFSFWRSGQNSLIHMIKGILSSNRVKGKNNE